MKQASTKAIILTRTDYAETDRILTVITPDQGKRSLLAKGVRKSGSKMAGGIELFSISDISYIKGRGSTDMLSSSRLQWHAGNISSELPRTLAAYDLLKVLNKVTSDHDHNDVAYFRLLEYSLRALNDLTIPAAVVELWFYVRLLFHEGQIPSFEHDIAQQPLTPDAQYDFSLQSMLFEKQPSGVIGAGHIKLFRLTLHASPEALSRIKNIQKTLEECLSLVKTICRYQGYL